MHQGLGTVNAQIEDAEKHIMRMMFSKASADFLSEKVAHLHKLAKVMAHLKQLADQCDSNMPKEFSIGIKGELVE